MYHLLPHPEINGEINLKGTDFANISNSSFCNTLAGNIISSGTTFTERLRNSAKHFLGTPDETNAFECYTNELFDRCSAYSIIQALRNLYQHGSLIVDTPTIDSKTYAHIDLLKLLHARHHSFRGGSFNNIMNIINSFAQTDDYPSLPYTFFIETYNAEVHDIFSVFLKETYNYFDKMIKLTRRLKEEISEVTPKTNEVYFKIMEDKGIACVLDIDGKSKWLILHPDSFESHHKYLFTEITERAQRHHRNTTGYWKHDSNLK